MLKNNKLKSKPSIYGGLFFFIIIVFGFIYAIFPSTIIEVNNIGNNIGNAFYFSIVTITTLGYGDIRPANGLGQALVCLEVLGGVVSIGLFLNAISEAQTQRSRYSNEKAKLRQHYLLLSKLFEGYLQTAFCVVTPKEKQVLPADVLTYKFEFAFNDMADLNDSVSNYFDIHDRLYQELRHTVDNVDLSFWPSLETDIHHFIHLCSEFTYKDTIITNTYITPFGDPNQSRRMVVNRLIHDHVGDLSKVSNELIPYVALYNMLKANTKLLQQIAYRMANEIA